MRIALATCSAFPDGDEDFAALAAALDALDAEAVSAVWDDPSVDWAAFDLTVIRTTWDYTRRYDEFLAWTRRVPRLANPAPLVAWNTTKTYLRDLAEAGVPVVPTDWYEPGGGGFSQPDGQFSPPAAAEYVVKPAVGAGSRDVGRFRAGADDGAAARHVAGLLAAGKTAMVQPYLDAVDTAGESALVYFKGVYSHAIRKGPMLDRPGIATGADDEDFGLFLEERISPRVAGEEERALAERVLAAVPGEHGEPLYARVDMVPGPDGAPVLLELELTEPSLFLSYAPGAVERCASALVTAVTV
ncbi:MAG: hypothetical protein ACJ73S_14910 [Mycobacteriales bacterium]